MGQNNTTMDIWPNSHRGGLLFPYRSKRSKCITQKKKLRVNVYVRMCMCIHWQCWCEAVVHSSHLPSPYTKLFSGSPIVGRPQGCTFPQELYKCNAAATFTSIQPYVHLPLSIGRLANGINTRLPLFLKRNTRNGYKRYLVNFLPESFHKYSLRMIPTNELKFNKLKTIKRCIGSDKKSM